MNMVIMFISSGLFLLVLYRLFDVFVFADPQKMDKFFYQQSSIAIDRLENLYPRTQGEDDTKVIFYHRFRHDAQHIGNYFATDARYTVEQDPQRLLSAIEDISIPLTALNAPLKDFSQSGAWSGKGALIALIPELGGLPRAFVSHSPLTGSTVFRFNGTGWTELRFGLHYDMRTGCTTDLPNWIYRATKHLWGEATSEGLSNIDCLIPFRAEFR